MWRLSLRILLLALLQYAIADEKIEDCPPNKACVIFGKFKCKVNNVMPANVAEGGYVYEDKDSCTGIDYYGAYTDKHYARLDFEPVTLRRWSFVLNHWDRREDSSEYREVDPIDKSIDKPHIDNIAFTFDNAVLTFPSKTEVQFAWQKEGTTEWTTALYPLKFNREFDVDEYKYMQYSFDISSDEKLVTYFAKKSIIFTRDTKRRNMTLNDQRFVERFDTILACESDELSELRACHGDCEEVQTSNGTAAASCSSNSSFWFHDTNNAVFTRHWRRADEIKCRLGAWQAQWQGGHQLLESSMEVQCSAAEPAKMMPATKGLIGGSCALLFIVLVLVVICVWRKRKAKNQADAATFSTASTPGVYRPPTITSNRMQSVPIP